MQQRFSFLPAPSKRSVQGIPQEHALQAVTEAVRALQGLSYGTVTLTVKDGQIVQLECAEKRRVLPKP